MIYEPFICAISRVSGQKNLAKVLFREGALRAGNFLPPFQISRFFQESLTMLSIESVLTLLLIKQDSSL